MTENVRQSTATIPHPDGETYLTFTFLRDSDSARSVGQRLAEEAGSTLLGVDVHPVRAGVRLLVAEIARKRRGEERP